MCVCVLEKERDGRERLLAFWMCEEEEDRTDSGRKLGRMEKTQPISRKFRICVNRSVSRVKNKHEA